MLIAYKYMPEFCVKYLLKVLRKGGDKYENADKDLL